MYHTHLTDEFSKTCSSQFVPPPITVLLFFFVLDSWWRCNGSVNEAWRGESWTMPKGGGAKTPQLDHFPLNTDMVEKQGGKKVRPANYSVSLELVAQDLMPGKMYLQQEFVWLSDVSNCASTLLSYSLSPSVYYWFLASAGFSEAEFLFSYFGKDFGIVLSMYFLYIVWTT